MPFKARLRKHEKYFGGTQQPNRSAQRVLNFNKQHAAQIKIKT